MTQALHTAIESVKALSLEEKHQLWLILDEAIAQAEEQDWLEDDETVEEIQQFFVFFDIDLGKKCQYYS